MGDLQARGLSGIGVGNFDSSPRADATEVGASETIRPSESLDLLAVLRQNLNQGLQPPAAIMHATAEAARILTGADGAALALRTRGVIVCRACSGDPTPDLGAPLNVDSGISGECLRAASILVCDDAENDVRVDPEVCRYLGIRSIVVVPLRGPAGIAGILEAFSTRTGAFREKHIDWLRTLAEIAEAAYGREVRGLQEAPVAPPKASRIRMLSDGTPDRGATRIPAVDGTSPARRAWFIGIAVGIMLLVAGVWLSGHEPALETSAKEPPPAQLHPTDAPVPAPAIETPLKPKPGIPRSDRSAAETLKNAAQVEVIDSARPAPVPSSTAEASSPVAAAQPATATSPDPPSVAGYSSVGSSPVESLGTESAIASSESRDQLARLTASASPLPSLDAAVSQGITAGRLVRKVDPIYPAQARVQHLAGTVALEITIADDGRVREVKQVSGSPMLAAAASEAIRKWRYTPFLLNGKPLEVQKQISVIFKLP